MAYNCLIYKTEGVNVAIDKQLLKIVMIDRKEVIQRLSVIKREIVIENQMPSIIIGVRRCGKSFILYEKMNELILQGHSWDEFVYINFEDERLIGFDVADFNTIIEIHYSLCKKEPILFLDEVQNILGWEKFARRMADEKRTVFITGSNSSMLSSEMESILGGRYLTFKAYTYSFSEFLSAKLIIWNEQTLLSTKGRAEIIQNFEDYLNYGGFPELIGIIDKRNYLSSIYSKIFLGDIIARYGVSNTIALEVMMKKIAETIRHPISYSRLTHIVNSIGISVGKSTIIQYLEHSKESHLLFSIHNYASKLVENVTTPKYYFIDTGILNLFVLNASSALLENLIAINLIRKYGRDSVFYYQDNIEVDFYISKVSLAVQVCYTLSDIKTREREVNALVKMSNHLDLSRMVIITYDEDEVIKTDDSSIEVISAWRWLLQLYSN